MTAGRSCSRRTGIHFVAFALSIIGLLYCNMMFSNVARLIEMKHTGELGSAASHAITAIVLLFNVFFILMLTSFIQAATTNPGVVPPNWGFYMGDETKRRRYCKMCNVWKPDRTHHCSICNRCVLNMDHHCPWINNCVGFYNRKYFMQLILYVYCCLIISTPFSLFHMYDRVSQISTLLEASSNYSFQWGDVFNPISAMLSLVLMFALTNFIKFHYTLVNDNFTTIENLERERNAKSKYDIGRRRNWEQVFGINPFLWFLPYHTATSRPAGDGVRWRVHYSRVVDEDDEQNP